MARILVVEDDDLNRNLVERILTLEKHEVCAVGTAEEGVGKALEFEPRLILLDIRLPGMSGIEAARALRKYPQFARTPIVALSAFAMQADIDEARKAGFDEYLTKPYEMADLLGMVDRMLSCP